MHDVVFMRISQTQRHLCGDIQHLLDLHGLILVQNVA